MKRHAHHELPAASPRDQLPDLIARYGMRLLHNTRRLRDFWPERSIK